MRDEKRFLSGRKITSPPQVFIGAAVNRFVPPLDYRPVHFAKKIAAGAQFVQTQYCYDVPLLKRFMARVYEQGLQEKCFILVGVGPLASGWSPHCTPSPVRHRMLATPIAAAPRTSPWIAIRFLSRQAICMTTA